MSAGSQYVSIILPAYNEAATIGRTLELAYAYLASQPFEYELIVSADGQDGTREAAEAVGKKLKELAATKQVLCITHLPQIASFADQHFLIEKKESGGRTKTYVRPLGPEERTKELARMISGAKLTDTSIKHAEQMLKANR